MPSGYVATHGDVEAGLRRIDHTLRPLEIVVVNTSASREIRYSHLEKLPNLEQLPRDGFEVVCFPVKVHRASAGWTRAVAFLPG